MREGHRDCVSYHPLNRFDIIASSDMVAEKFDMKSTNSDGNFVPAVEIKEQNKPSSWKEALFGFTQNTTLHGVRFIFMENVFVLRRLIWMVVFLTCAVLMSVQIIERIVYYYSYPVTVNVHVNFNKTLAFPSLTLCNQNAFRARPATQHGLYRLIEEMHSGTPMNASSLSHFGMSNLTLDQLYLLTAHRKEDLIIKCQWQHLPCGPENFTEILTDHGVCYNFNDNLDNLLWVTSTGADYGLKLTLNVEQYEYMPGPHNAAGIKILLHDQKEFPKVAELGLSVPTGTHTYMGIQLLRIQNLPAPHGSCRSERSSYYDQYSPDACHLACTTQLIEQMCGCRHFFMPDINGTPPVCSLHQYLSCYLPNIGMVKEKVLSFCECPVPCDFLIYDPTISFASTSVYATDRLLADTGSTPLHQNFLHARETTARMDQLKFGEFKDLELDMRSKFEELKNVIENSIKDKMESQKDTLMAIHDSIKQAYEQHRYLLEWQEYHILKNFMRARNAMEERTLGYLALGFQELGFQIDSRINQMSTGPNSTIIYPDDVRTSLYLELNNLIFGRVDLAERAYDNYTQLFGAYVNGTPIFRYKFKNELRNDNVLVTPKALLNESLYHNSYARRYSVSLGSDINLFKDRLLDYAELSNRSYFNGDVDPVEVHANNVQFMRAGRKFYMSRSSFYSECVEYPYRVTQQRLLDIDLRWRTFETDFYQIHKSVTQLLLTLDNLKESILNSLQHGVMSGQTYVLFGNVTKMEVAQELTSENIFEGISALKVFFGDIRSRGQNVYDGWTKLIASTNQVWGEILEDENLVHYYTEKSMELYLRSYQNVSSEVDSSYLEYRDQYDFRFLLGNLDSQFLLSLQVMMDNMQDFIDNSALDTEFIKKNFLQLDVFYREKSYEQITQQKGYDLFALLCDIGGSMGLFVGASVMTMCELLDLGLHQSLDRLNRYFR